ncbi:saccharopine dehydrogenase NADP binding domain-containing protein [Hirsutella rhossiliensis]|uniref:Saccharopine dehydrogenase NADP binding domain-containing protein n=1 Tax=Hirsutella rhossiliensis TaxID=111463 RepID=A0A9P8MXE0_9HYPO|nr:saccharopine dehydrogenase NADP binding domain-containing protein [Hirsutella rhossiliensis]KAH0962985.1 saccharopine dehydrogenase NADP binding domain-containing protein [Hirsutella rhossiliensis]
MGLKQHHRQYDLVILGATGYTGRLTVEHVAARLPPSLKWAIAGRSESKLQALADECAKSNPDMSRPELEIFNVGDDSQVSSLVGKTALVITTVGPFCKYGESVFNACAQLGTHYLDCTGEVPWVARMIKKYQDVAQGSGAIMIPQNGVESAAADLCTWAMVRLLRSKLDAYTKDVVFSVHKASLTPSGGTLATALTIFEHFSLSEVSAIREPYCLSPIPHPEKARPDSSFLQTLFGIRDIPDLGVQTTSVLGAADVPIVERSWGLLSQIPARKDEFYGPRFNFAEYLKPRNWFHGIVIHWALLTSLMVISLIPPVRAIVKRFVYEPGQGISKEEMAKEEVEFRGTATPDAPSSPGKQAFCRAQFHGSLYQLTALHLAQAALTILEDDVGLQGGVYTPACLGQGYLDRVNDAGFKIDVKLLQN